MASSPGQLDLADVSIGSSPAARPTRGGDIDSTQIDKLHIIYFEGDAEPNLINAEHPDFDSNTYVGFVYDTKTHDLYYDNGVEGLFLAQLNDEVTDLAILASDSDSITFYGLGDVVTELPLLPVNNSTSYDL